jgi:hypothetical protein
VHGKAVVQTVLQTREAKLHYDTLDDESKHGWLAGASQRWRDVSRLKHGDR